MSRHSPYTLIDNFGFDLAADSNETHLVHIDSTGLSFPRERIQSYTNEDDDFLPFPRNVADNGGGQCPVKSLPRRTYRITSSRKRE
ncbi:hypothetical protein AA0113_g10296 [Alternaria arborescens]|uniref:Uncharacterized protein n=1 Tax=Alternaria arborescens TaxID=156630 RepID=A0A4Q4QQB9_9PLEO|nr:hypothetical protein AA0111_g9728 [Alternaria arborescens]RYN19994.1 hypothetical protein AA0112_g10943 [Alternaria arborescens]RYO21272.1 hypothetical protein AA0111_g9728 [Alternaria arborescens]RYO45697.1 hypothetical protein AA0113_g10296 [Alternaria arborescens]